MKNTLLSIPDDVAAHLEGYSRGLHKHIRDLKQEHDDCEKVFSDTNPDWHVHLWPEHVRLLIKNLTTVADFCEWLATREVQERAPDQEGG